MPHILIQVFMSKRIIKRPERHRDPSIKCGYTYNYIKIKSLVSNKTGNYILICL